MIRTVVIILAVGVLAVVIGVGGHLHLPSNSSESSLDQTQTVAATLEQEQRPSASEDKNARCLEEGEVARVDGDDLVDIGDLIVTITDKGSGQTISSFAIPDAELSTVHRADIRRCGVYALKVFGSLDSTYKPSADYSVEIWKYDYRGEGRVVLQTVRINGLDEAEIFYSRQFRVDPHEKYITLRRGYVGSNDHALVIKNLETLRDILVLSAHEIASRNPGLTGDLNFLDWTRNGRYFWLNLGEGAYVNGWVRVDSQNWSYELYQAPGGVLGGYPLNIETGWVPVIPGAFWTGVVEFDEEIERERRALGETADLYLYNVFTKQNILIEDTDAPTWGHPRLKWLSDTELEYVMPNEVVKTYRVPE